MKRIIFGTLWFFAFSLLYCIIGGASVGLHAYFTGGDAAEAGRDFGLKYNKIALIVDLVVTVLATAYGILPGTGKKLKNKITPVTTPDVDWHNDPGLSEKWRFRFGFFEKHGVPGIAESFAGTHAMRETRETIKQMSFGDRIKLNMNFYAFFFGIVYFAFFLKLWRQALILIAIVLGYVIITVFLDIPDGMDEGFSLVYSLFCAARANPLYYLKRTQGRIGWRI